MADKTSDPQQDALFREVEEDLRHEQLHRLWKKYGLAAVGAAILVVAIVAGYQGWHAYQAQRQDADATAFEQAVEMVPKEAAAALATVSQTAQVGTAALAALRRAAFLSDIGKTDDALNVYQTLYNNADRDPILRDVAVLRYALLGMDHGVESATLTSLVTPLSVAGKPMEFSARQILAMLALKDGKTDQAEKILHSLVDDAKCPPGIRARATNILSDMASQRG